MAAVEDACDVVFAPVRDQTGSPLPRPALEFNPARILARPPGRAGQNERPKGLPRSRRTSASRARVRGGLVQNTGLCKPSPNDAASARAHDEQPRATDRLPDCPHQPAAVTNNVPSLKHADRP